MKNYFITLILLAVTSGVFSQITLHLQISPSNPSNSDSVTVIAPIALWDGCVKLDSTIFQSGNNLLITACYDYGWGSAGQVWYDTAHYHLGVLPNGTYTVKYIVRATQADVNDTLCNNYSLLDSTTKTFTIGPLAVDETEDFSTEMFPNPTSNKLNLQLTNALDKVSFQILSTDGRLLMRSTITQHPNFEIDVSTLPAGLYFLQLQNENQGWVKKFVKY